jgi:hypothetical protein
MRQKKLHNEELRILTCSNEEQMRLIGHVTHMGEMRNATKKKFGCNTWRGEI